MIDGDLMANRRKRDIAALERQLAELNLEEPSSSDTAIENIEAGCHRGEAAISVCGCHRRVDWLGDGEAETDFGVFRLWCRDHSFDST